VVPEASSVTQNSLEERKDTEDFTNSLLFLGFIHQFVQFFVPNETLE